MNILRMMRFAFIFLFSSPVFSSEILPISVNDLDRYSETVFRGSLISKETVKVSLSKGHILATEYTFSVSEGLKGSALDAKEIKFTMMGTDTSPNRDIPHFERDIDYMVFLNKTSSAGLTTPVALKGGVFTLSRKGKKIQAINGFNNNNFIESINSHDHSLEHSHSHTENSRLSNEFKSSTLDHQELTYETLRSIVN